METIPIQDKEALFDSPVKPAVERLWRQFYPDFRPFAFQPWVEGHLRPDSDVLEVGAGSGVGMQVCFDLKGRCRRHVGIDLDERVLDNPRLDEARVADAAALPFPDQSFDLLFHRMVAEHISRPAEALKEAARVLKPGGICLFETPSRFYYPMLLSRLTPTRVHRALVKRLGTGRASHEVFDTVYGLNDRATIRQLASQAGLDAEIIHRTLPPGYLRRSSVLFSLGILYERTVERAFPQLRGVLWVKLTKPQARSAPTSMPDSMPDS